MTIKLSGIHALVCLLALAMVAPVQADTGRNYKFT
ncbi:MAG: hypothetical protein RLZZ09_1647, partial [Pseudomonadota bacterium]